MEAMNGGKKLHMSFTGRGDGGGGREKIHNRNSSLRANEKESYRKTIRCNTAAVDGKLTQGLLRISATTAFGISPQLFMRACHLAREGFTKCEVIFHHVYLSKLLVVLER
jgi:hypothetical protein